MNEIGMNVLNFQNWLFSLLFINVFLYFSLYYYFVIYFRCDITCTVWTVLTQCLIDNLAFLIAKKNITNPEIKRDYNNSCDSTI